MFVVVAVYGEWRCDTVREMNVVGCVKGGICKSRDSTRINGLAHECLANDGRQPARPPARLIN